MNPSKKSTPKAAEKVEAESFPTGFATLFSNGLERAVEVSKKTLDLAAQHNAEVLENCKKAIKLTPSTPGAMFFDLAGQAFESYVEMQKGMMDLLLEQSAVLLETNDEREAAVGRVTARMEHAVEQSVDRAIAANKMVLDFASRQNKAVNEAIKQVGFAGTPAALAVDSIHRGVDSVIETQKEILEIAAKPLKAAAAKA